MKAVVAGRSDITLTITLSAAEMADIEVAANWLIPDEIDDTYVYSNRQVWVRLFETVYKAARDGEYEAKGA